MKLHDPAHTLRVGVPLERARAGVILIHGRGASAEEIAALAEALPGDGIAFLAPSAANNNWYPQRFLAPVEQNEPWLSSALSVLERLVGEAHDAGLPFDRIGLIGFSQGACLALESAARHPRRYGFIAGLSGALIGPLDRPRLPFDLAGTPVLVACADNDPHIPINHVEESARVLSRSGAAVTKQIFPGAGHKVYSAEVDWLRERMTEGLKD